SNMSSIALAMGSVKAFAEILGLMFWRIQFTPDLLPADTIGTKVWKPEKGAFEVVKGPIFLE
ncbi:AAA family ATPase, partial [Serratia marcescens]|uniref:AAA family ATPase n=1 Tax=Serratia marcescens TaxID=615 RepID=UPI00195403B4